MDGSLHKAMMSTLIMCVLKEHLIHSSTILRELFIWPTQMIFINWLLI